MDNTIEQLGGVLKMDNAPSYRLSRRTYCRGRTGRAAPRYFLALWAVPEKVHSVNDSGVLLLVEKIQ
jgi:hypothetical protein